VGASMRTKDADESLVFIGNGGKASSGTVDDGNLNYNKGDVFSSAAKAVGELELKRTILAFSCAPKPIQTSIIEVTKFPMDRPIMAFVQMSH